MMSPMKPAPLQFVKLAPPSDRFRSAQDQLNKAVTAKPKPKEFDADWQSDLDNWKSNRRKQQEHIIERLVEVKKFETDRLDDGFRKRSKTFNEMIQERGRSGRLRSLPALYQDDDDGNDLSDLGISTGGKKSEDSSDECSKNGREDEVFREEVEQEEESRDPGAVTSERNENGYDRAIKDYVDFAESKRTAVVPACSKQEDDDGERQLQLPTYRKPAPLLVAEAKRRMSAPKIEEKVMLLKIRSQSTKDLHSAVANELPKVDIGKRREVFEKAATEQVQPLPVALKPTKKKLSEPVGSAAPRQESPPPTSTKPTFESQPESTCVASYRNEEEQRSVPLVQQQQLQDDSVEEEEKPIVAMEKERPSMAPSTAEDEYRLHNHELSLSDLVSRHSIDSLDQEECGHHTTEDPDDGNYPGSCLSAEDSGIHTEDMSSCVSQADDEEQRSNLQPSPIQQHQLPVVPHVETSYNMVLELTPVNALEPPKEKPPPPPVDDDDSYAEAEVNLPQERHLTAADAVDSAKRIKKEMWMKRSSFLGLEEYTSGNAGYEQDLENLKSRPPDLTSFLEEERRLEKLLYKQNKPERPQDTRIYENVNAPTKNVYIDDGGDIESNQYMRDILQVEEQSRCNQLKNKAAQNNIGEKLVKKLKELEEDLNNQECMRVGSAHWLPSPNRHSLQDISSVANARPPLDHTQSMPNLEQQPIHNQHHQPEEYTWSQNSCPRPAQQPNMYAKRKSTNSQPEQFNYQHWLIQEAEHRRLVDRCNRQVPPPSASDMMPRSCTRPALPPPPPPAHNKKPLPDSVINTITQRVQDRLSFNDFHRHDHGAPQESMLSVSGKKKCSHCTVELGRGAAMIIESLQLFYHIECFKCCVCCVQLGDGLMGTDVRVRNKKLHCQNCFSSDDGVKFSCV
ncbi:uncharacterized protein LOC126838002 isoform X2 [Adelges cooleyi]|uniref:uncharacterized protein LOC126838002 isoform X2 n=1 Tax=Adelges cooleyi TaxID=133065 RepID=UPI00217F822B|nr:uncharacterized protein LOC126838002 isoform X2 [Adelges cooleyi]